MNRKAFTLIELLVVVAVLALLASIVFSNLGGAREGARISNALSFQSQTHSLLGSDLVGWWNFNEGSGTTARDISGYDNHGTIVGATYVDGVSGTGGTALSFNGSSNYLTIGNLQILNDNFISVSAWVKRGESHTWNGSLFGFGTTSTNTQDVYFWGGDSGKAFGFNTWNSDSWGFSNSINSKEVMDGEWHHLVASFNRSDIKLSRIFIDGTEKNLSQVRGTTLDRSISNNFGVGLNGWNTSNQLFNGPIDDVRIYSRALTASEVQTLYAQTKDKYLAGD